PHHVGEQVVGLGQGLFGLVDELGLDHAPALDEVVALGHGQRPNLELGDAPLALGQFVLGLLAVAHVVDGRSYSGPKRERRRAVRCFLMARKRMAAMMITATTTTAIRVTVDESMGRLLSAVSPPRPG